MTEQREFKCLECGLPITANADTLCNHCYEAKENYWEADLCPVDPDNFWINRSTGERIKA